MWQVLFTVINAVALQCIATHVLINKTDVQVAYHVNNGSHCESGEHRFQIILQQTLPDCVIECALREHCAVMNYRAAMNLCELHLKEESSNSSHRCISVRKNDIQLIKTPCNDNSACQNGTVCDRKSKSCLIKECVENPGLDNGRVLGNRRNVGSRIVFKCNQGYKLSASSSKTAVCNDGQWSTSGQCVLGIAVGEPCIGPVCLDDNARCVNRTIDTSYCHCKFGFEFDELLGICVKVCNQFSNDSSAFVEEPFRRTREYHMNEIENNIYTFSDCVNFCYQNYPQFLSINFYPDNCNCKSISKKQYIKAHNSLANAFFKSFYNRPCVS